MIQETIQRVVEMERYFDLLQKAAKEDPALLSRDPSYGEMLRSLKCYYESGQWLRDYELDEQGCFPPELKRGVLSQDGIFEFLEEMKV